MKMDGYLTNDEVLRIRTQAFHFAHETNPLRFNVEQKPTTEELLEEARKIEAFLING